MIERLQAIATFLSHFRLLLMGLGMGFLGIFVLSLFDSGLLPGDDWLIPALVGLCWSLTLYSLSTLFSEVPPPADSGSAWRVRLSVTVRRGLLWLLALLMIVLSIALLILSYQLLRTWI
jgi:hypothetical protein